MAALRRLLTADSLRRRITSTKTLRPQRNPSDNLAQTLTRIPSNDPQQRLLQCRRLIFPENKFRPKGRSFFDGHKAQYSSISALRRTTSIKTPVPSRSLSYSVTRNLQQRPRLWRCVTSGSYIVIIFYVLVQTYFKLQDIFKDEKATSKSSMPEESSSSNVDMETIAKEARKTIEELLEKRGMKTGSYPQYSVTTENNQKIIIRVQTPPAHAWDTQELIDNLVGLFNVEVDLSVGNRGSNILLKLWWNKVSYILSPLENQKLSVEKLRVVVYRRHFSLDKSRIEFVKEGRFSHKELDAFVDVLQIAGRKLRQVNADSEIKRRNKASKKTISSLQKMGVKVYGLDARRTDKISWNNFAGYDQLKRKIEDTVLLALQRPRGKSESNQPRAILFEGPSGTGKTSISRAIGGQAGVPLLYVPPEIIIAERYGDRSRLLGKLFSLANELPTGAVIFLDEIDSFAGGRYTHKETSRTLSVLLHQIDVFEQDKKVIVIGVTNRKEALYPDLMSCFEETVSFGLPNEQNRQKIVAEYAKHLTKDELVEFSQAMKGKSGRDIREVCQKAERSWASKIIRGEVSNDENESLPPLQEYIGDVINPRKSPHDVVIKKEDQRPEKEKINLLTTPTRDSKPSLQPAPAEGPPLWRRITSDVLDFEFEKQMKFMCGCFVLATGSCLLVAGIPIANMISLIVKDGVLQLVDSIKDASMPLLLQLVANEGSEPVATSNVDLEVIAKEVRKKLEKLLQKKGMQKGSYLRYRVFVKDRKLMIGIQVPPACHIQDLIQELPSSIRVVCSRTLTSPDEIEMRIVKEESFTDKELGAVIDVLQITDSNNFEGKLDEASRRELISSLQGTCVKLYGFDDAGQKNCSLGKISWENIAGYDQQKREIEDTVLLALQSPYILDDIARRTHNKFESNRPRAIFFEGPPGTGKTTSARVIANQAGVPLLYVPLEIIMSKMSNQCQRLVEKVFSLANTLPTGAIIYIDGIDSLAGSRDKYMDLDKRQILSLLLRQIDGFEDKKVVVIGATKHKEKLHPSLISRFEATINFELPDEQNRQKIAAKMAEHLTKHEVVEFAQSLKGMSGRDIRDVCERAEISWVSKITRGEAGRDGKEPLPPLHEYIENARNKQKSFCDAGATFSS